MIDKLNIPCSFPDTVPMAFGNDTTILEYLSTLTETVNQIADAINDSGFDGDTGNGYVKLSGGTLIMYGSGKGTSQLPDTLHIVFPIPFTSTDYTLIASPRYVSGVLYQYTVIAQPGTVGDAWAYIRAPEDTVIDENDIQIAWCAIGKWK